MEIYDEKYRSDKTCPPISCKKKTCKCGLEKIVLPAALGDDSKDSPIAPKNGDYCDAVVAYEANGHIYIYSKEGIPTLITSGGGGNYDEIIKEIQEDLTKTEDDLAKEILDRAAGDKTLQDEIDEMKNSPDVVDIVATYAALQAYDTSKLGDNDIIRVLADETHDGDSTYYRWDKNNSTWVYIGAVSLTANTIFYANVSESGSTRHIYKNSDMTGTVSVQDILDANEKGQVILRMSTALTPENFNDTYLQNTYVGVSDYQFLFLDNRNYYEYDATTTADTTYYYSKSTIQLEMSAGTNITITGNTISATDTTYNNFIGTDGVDAGTSGLVPAPATTDAGKFLKADGTWETIQAGGVKTLTTADYNYPTNNPTYINLGLLDSGVYFIDDDAMVYNGINVNKYRSSYTFVVSGGDGDSTLRNIMVVYPAAAASSSEYKIRFFYTFTSNPYPWMTRGNILSTDYIIDNLTTNNASRVLSAAQGVALKSLINGLVISGAGAPTTSTVGTVGQLYEDTTNGDLYQCTAVSGSTYTWSEVGAGGGSGPTVVQTTGTSTTDVMSQDATTKMIFPKISDPTIIEIGRGSLDSAVGSMSIGIGASHTARGEAGIAIGQGASIYATGEYSIAIGNAAKAEGHSRAIALGNASHAAFDNSVAIGTNAKTTRIGEVNVGAGTSGRGYNSTNYRVIGGVHDGQDTHDAATVAQGNTLSASAPDSSTVGVLGQLWTDTTNMHTYQCTAISGSTYTWTQRW